MPHEFQVDPLLYKIRDDIDPFDLIINQGYT